MSLNRFVGIGNLTKDPDLRYTPKGTPVCEIGIAINRVWVTDQGERREDCTFLDVTYWGKRAENLAKFVKKGRPLYIEARIENQSWDDKETGKKRHKLALIGEDFQFIGGKPDSEGDHPPASRSSEPPAAKRPPAPPPKDPDLDPEPDDIPFG